MSYIRFAFFALVLGSLTAVPVTLSAASDKADELARIEAQGLKTAGKQRLEKLVAQPAAPKGDVQLSRKRIDAQPKAAGGAQWRCLAEALYFEARGETVKGQFAVA